MTKRTSMLSPARLAAWRALRAFAGAAAPPLDDILHETLAGGALSPVDSRLFFQIAQGVVRHRAFLDAVIDRFARGGPRAVAPEARDILRVGAYQSLFLDRVPPHAIVAESVELVRAARLPERATGFVNAVMRKFASLDRQAELTLAPEAPRASVLLRYSMPTWIADEWTRVFGPESLREECEALAQNAPLDLRINPLKADAETARARLLDDLKALGLDEGAVERGRFCPLALRLRESVAPERLSVVRDGCAVVQDEAAQMVPLWLEARPGMKVLDLCAAPGGKTTHLAALMRNEGLVVALDASEERLRLVAAACVRLSCQCVRTAVNTPETRAALLAEIGPFDAALVDAPCTSLGTLRRHPDVKWRKRPTDLESIARLQLQTLEDAASCVRPGGLLVYSVCTFTRAETTGVIAAFLARHSDWHRAAELPAPAGVPDRWQTSDGDWRTLTGRDGIDGFFVARLIKSSA